jgi:hypothetical protein
MYDFLVEVHDLSNESNDLAIEGVRIQGRSAGNVDYRATSRRQ